MIIRYKNKLNRTKSCKTCYHYGHCHLDCYTTMLYFDTSKCKNYKRDGKIEEWEIKNSDIELKIIKLILEDKKIEKEKEKTMKRNAK